MNTRELKDRDGGDIDEFRLKLETESHRNTELERLNGQLIAQRQMLYKMLQELSEKEADIRKKSEELFAQKEEIEIQNKKLLEYAFFNSHKVRGPLARILGLVYLMKLEVDETGHPDNDNDRFLEKLTDSAKELDLAVREMSAFLNE